MPLRKAHTHPVALLQAALHTLVNNPVILFPFFILVFIQLLTLQIIYFAPRYPLSVFFEPVITRLEGDVFMHYPYNFDLLQKWFSKIQYPIFLFFNSFLIGAAVFVIYLINGGHEVRIKEVFRRTFSSYVHLFCTALIAVSLTIGFYKLYGLLVERALEIRSLEGKFFLLKKIILVGGPYFNLLFAIFVGTLFSLVIPIIMIHQKKVLPAIKANFFYVCKYFKLIFLIVFLTSMLYSPLMLLKSNKHLFEAYVVPEFWGFFLIVGIFTQVFIDAIQHTSLTTFYLAEQESK